METLAPATPKFTDLDIAFLSIFFITITLYILYHSLHPYLVFAYNCFLKPHTGDKTGTQQEALESFYKGQATVYDATRSRLLRGREEMLQLAAAQLKARMKTEKNKMVWVDVGGGTGYNIETLNRYLSVPDNFEKVYLVDLSPSLCAVARSRFQKLGWTNVVIVCMDAREFRAKYFGKDQKANWITMSYSLSMIPDYYSVIDSLVGLLHPTGLISVVDFYVQSAGNVAARTYTGGIMGRHVNWISRQFWRIWFEFDRVNLDESRRDYVEYRFGTILSMNERNVLFGGIPYYIWLGTTKLAASVVEELAIHDAAVTESPYLGPLKYLGDINGRHGESESQSNDAIQLRSKAYEAAVYNMATNLPLPSFFYQNQPWRIYYDETLKKHQHFNNSYIYAFTWEDSKVDIRLLKPCPSDTILAITSAGDNALSYLLAGSPRRIHCVDLNPSQNHLLELKLASYAANIPYTDFWSLFGLGHHPSFRSLLIEKLSPHLSSRAFLFWLDNASTFTSKRSGGLYHSGQSGIAIKSAKWLFRVFGRTGDVQALCTAETINEQREIWDSRIRPVMLNYWVSRIVIGNSGFLWKALGVPENQRDIIIDDYRKLYKPVKRDANPENANEDDKLADLGPAIWTYVVDTLDPIVENTLLSSENHFYHLCLMGRYSARSHPAYLSPTSYKRLSDPTSSPLSALRLHTDDLLSILSRMQASSLTIAVIMDSMDWFSPVRTSPAERQIAQLYRVLKPGGRVLLRSAGRNPWYLRLFELGGFAVKTREVRERGKMLDWVNMYASTVVLVKKEENRRTRDVREGLEAGLRRMSEGSKRDGMVELDGEGRRGNMEKLDLGVAAM